MGLRLLLLNCNNTLRESINNPGDYINEPTDQRLIEGAARALSKLDESWSVVGIHNAGGITTYNPATQKMFQTMEDSIKEQRYTLKLARAIKPIKAIFICPASKGTGKTAKRITATTIRDYTGDGYRLPNPGMLAVAIAYAATSKTESIIYVGDEDTDLEAVEILQKTEKRISFERAADWWQ